ncbi:MAG: MarR family transcriptional regulator [Solirubrobacteraceae bacterium]|nr:MarR family transcriptional regulator [Solirubrobacteraceae bacterium]
MARPDQPADDGPLDPTELAAWRGMLRVHARVTAILDAQMREAHGLTVSQYEVLLFLGDAPDGQMRMADLASRALLTRSGMTRLVDRLVELRYVERAAAEGDGRGAFACLTPAGADALRVAQRTHRRGIREEFLRKLPQSEQLALGNAWEHVLRD